jgi:hypothetical protein
MQRSNNNAAVTSGFNLGGIAMSGHDGTNYGLGWNGGAEITAYSSQTWTPSSRGTSLAFSTTPDNTTAITERMRINSNGTSVFGGVVTGTAPSSAKVYVNNGSNENIGNATWGGSLVINEYSNTLNANMGLEFKTRADGGGYGWRISSLANNPDFIFESRLNSAAWTERMRIESSGKLSIAGGGINVEPSRLEMRPIGATDTRSFLHKEVHALNIPNSSPVELTRLTSTGANGYRAYFKIIFTGHCASTGNFTIIREYFWDGGTNAPVQISTYTQGSVPTISFNNATSNVCIVNIASANGNNSRGTAMIEWLVPLDFAESTGVIS